MSANFDFFVLLAEMRTGSNFLETNLNAIDGVQCLGEAFNPHFIGYPNKTEMLGMTQAMRDADPMRLIEAVRQADGLCGFRYFHDHDARVLDPILEDPRCAKIILTRNPLDSYVSWKIAQATGQWKLTNMNRRKEAQAEFDAAEFMVHVETLQEFQLHVLNRLQSLGQAPFYIAYEDLNALAVINGLARWLGVAGRLETLDASLKRQNPAPVASKVSNPELMVTALSNLDQFNLTRTPNFEPRRGPAVPSYVACPDTPLIYLPIKGGPEREVIAWLSSLEGVRPDALHSKMNQKDLRQWKRRHVDHRSFTVLRHPVSRAHHVFCTRILATGEGSFAKLRETLRRQMKLPIPKNNPGKSYDRVAHRAAFVAFLDFLKANLAGQTAQRIDPSWCTQVEALKGFGDVLLPDFVLREDSLDRDLPRLADDLGRPDAPPVEPPPDDIPFSLADIYDDEIEKRVADIYQRDYVMFGFGPWRATE